MGEDRPVSNRTRILFALTGLIACLVGSVCAELILDRMKAGPLLRRHHAESILFATDPATTRTAVPVVVPETSEAEVQRRLQREGAQSGDVQISLTWNNRNDLDLGVMDPYGELIDGYNQSSRSGGVLDVDMNPTDISAMTTEAVQKSNLRAGRRRTHRISSSDTAPIENLVWANNAPVGHYKVYVHQFCNKERADHTPFWVVVRVHGKIHRIAGTTGREDFSENLVDPQLVYEFDVNTPEKEASTPEPVVPKPAAAPPPPPRIVTRVAYSLDYLAYALLSASLWGCLLGILPIALLVAQRLYLKLTPFQSEDDLIVATAGLATGATAAIVGQLLLALPGSVAPPSAYPGLCALAWTVAGAIFGGLISLYTPNIGRIAGPIAGAAGALVGSVALMLLGAAQLETPGRLLCAAIIGCAIGALIALPEREREPEPELEPEPPRDPYIIQPPFIVRGARTRKVGGLRQTGNPPDR